MGSRLLINLGEGLLEQQIIKRVVQSWGGGLQMMLLSKALGGAK